MNAKQQTGFTLIELVVVIVILGILAVTALPKFVDLKYESQLAAINGVAGAVSSAFAVNYGAYAVTPAKGSAVSGSVVYIQGMAGGIMAGGVPAGYTLVNAASNVATVACGVTSASSAGAAVAVTVSNAGNVTNAQTAAATLICTG